MLLMYATVVYNEYTEYVDLIVWELNSENCLDFVFVAPLVRKSSLYQIKTISHLP